MFANTYVKFCSLCGWIRKATEYIRRRSLLATLLQRLLVAPLLLARGGNDVGALHTARVGHDAADGVGLAGAYPAAVAQDGDVEAGERGLAADADAAELVGAGGAACTGLAGGCRGVKLAVLEGDGGRAADGGGAGADGGLARNVRLRNG